MKSLKSAIYAHGSEIYEISDEDIASDPSYFGYLNLSGGWIIQKRTASAGTYTYAQGSASYATNWSNRILLSYGLYSTLTLTNP